MLYIGYMLLSLLTAENYVLVKTTGLPRGILDRPAPVPADGPCPRHGHGEPADLVRVRGCPVPAWAHGPRCTLSRLCVCTIVYIAFSTLKEAIKTICSSYNSTTQSLRVTIEIVRDIIMHISLSSLPQNSQLR